jgi:Flp pilus assembly protein TadG
MVLSVLLMGIMGVFEYGRIVMMRQLMDNSVHRGARLAVVGTAAQPPVTTQQIIDTVNNGLAGQALSNVNVQVFQADPVTLANIGAWDTTPYGGAIAVQLDADYKPILPSTMGIVRNPIHFRAISVMLSEAN